MLRVKTYLSKSKISGIGLFAGEDIKKGTITWNYSPYFLIKLTQDDINKMSADEKKRFDILDHYWIDKNNNYIISLDNDRFMNHSIDPNVALADDNCEIAIKDIKIDEELTIDYRTLAPENMWEPYFKL